VVNPTGERKTGTASDEVRLSVTTACWAASLDLKLRSQSGRTPASGTFTGRDDGVILGGQQGRKQAAPVTGSESGAARPAPAHETRRAKGPWAARSLNRQSKLAAENKLSGLANSEAKPGRSKPRFRTDASPVARVDQLQANPTSRLPNVPPLSSGRIRKPRAVSGEERTRGT
jgi:hypothetical protein